MMTFPQDPGADRPPARAGQGGWIKVLLFTSLALNLAVAGLALGAWLRHDRMADQRPMRVDQIGGVYTGALSREDRRAIWRQMRETRADGVPGRAEMRAAYEAVVLALRAEPFDPGQVRAIVGQQFAAGIARQELGQSLLLARIEAMSPAERVAFADRLEAELARRRAPGAARAPAPDE
jgi:uncharacterized membrane protein